MKAIDEQHIRDMEPGIELDKLVAVHVMGWEVRREYERDGSFHEIYYRDGHLYENANYPDHWQPSKFIDAAWEVLDTRKNDYYVKRSAETGVFEVVMDYVIPAEEGKREWRHFVRVISKTAAEAISKCALIAILRGGSGK